MTYTYGPFALRPFGCTSYQVMTAEAVPEPVEARSSPPDPPSEDEAPPKPRRPPKPVPASGRYPAGYEHVGTVAEIAEQIQEVHTSGAKPLSMTPDAIAARARRGEKGSFPVTIRDVENGASYSLLCAELLRYHATEREGVRTQDPKMIEAMASAIETAEKTGNGLLGSIFVSIAYAWLGGHMPCLLSMMIQFQLAHKGLAAGIGGAIEQRRDASEN